VTWRSLRNYLRTRRERPETREGEPSARGEGCDSAAANLRGLALQNMLRIDDRVSL
jgi:hypothetical protein